MTCRDLAELLMEFLDGELAEEQCAGLRGHLNECPECVLFVQTYQVTIQVTRRLPTTAPPPELLERLRRALNEGA